MYTICIQAGASFKRPFSTTIQRTNKFLGMFLVKTNTFSSFLKVLCRFDKFESSFVRDENL